MSHEPPNSKEFQSPSLGGQIVHVSCTLSVIERIFGISENAVKDHLKSYRKKCRVWIPTKIAVVLPNPGRRIDGTNGLAIGESMTAENKILSQIRIGLDYIQMSPLSVYFCESLELIEETGQ